VEQFVLREMELATNSIGFSRDPRCRWLEESNGFSKIRYEKAVISRQWTLLSRSASLVNDLAIGI